MAEAKKQLSRNGGHTITHRFKPRTTYRGTRGGIGTDYPEAETHVFGPGDGKKMLAHVAKHLGVKPEAGEEGDE